MHVRAVPKHLQKLLLACSVSNRCNYFAGPLSGLLGQISLGWQRQNCKDFTASPCMSGLHLLIRNPQHISRSLLLSGLCSHTCTELKGSSRALAWLHPGREGCSPLCTSPSMCRAQQGNKAGKILEGNLQSCSNQPL